MTCCPSAHNGKPKVTEEGKKGSLKSGKGDKDEISPKGWARMILLDP